ncbi:MAG: magnesium chelatase subunit D [Paracoccaceae bacterium]
MLTRAATALSLLAIEPAGLKGLWLRARAGPVRDMVVAALSTPLPARRLHPTIADDALFGGLDLAATLANGHQVASIGLLDTPACLTLAMAERCPPGLAARLAQALDQPGHCLIALDEGDADEGLPSALGERLALFVDLGDVVWSDAALSPPDPVALAAARARLPQIATPPDAAALLTRAAASLGIASLRAPLLALAAARAAAALRGGDTITEADLRLAAELVFGHRAQPQPEAAPPQDTSEPPPPAPDQDNAKNTPQNTDIPDEILIEAARAALPPDLLAALNAGRAARAAKGASGTGGARAGNRRGRPMPSRAGRLGTGARLDLVATLRAAAPRQPIRRAQALRDATLHIRPGDIRLKRYVETSDRVLIFAVDASGSAAFARLAEAKGAVELLLAAAYARRDHVALLAFRGTAAELILPPTRSLVQTKRRLAGLPGGGGTPLAHGLMLAMATALQARARGLTPTIAVLTDGRGNIALDGTANRAQAEDDALKQARAIAATGLSAVMIDTGNRPQASLQTLAHSMAAPYVALPRADAHRLSAILGQALQ